MADDRRCLKSPTRWPQRLWVWCLALGCACQSAAALAEDAPKAPPAGGADAEDDGLPPGYEPPRDQSEIMLLEKELLTPDERKQLKRDAKNYTSQLRKGEMRTDEEKALVRNGIRYRLDMLTIPDNRKKLHMLREELVRQDLQPAGMLLSKPKDVVTFREQLMQMVVDETAKLFDNNLYVRIQAALILGELNLIDDNSKMVGMQLKLEAFAPAAKPLCAVLLDPEQPEDVKVPAVLSLIRILRLGKPDVNLKREIANAIIAELKRTNTHRWYQMRLAEALGHIDAPTLDLERQPFIYQALDSTVKDPRRALRVRVAAAWSLGRHPLDASVDLKQLTQDLVVLGLDVAVSFNQNPNEPQAKRWVAMLYLAFQAKDADDLLADRSRKAGLLNYPAAAVPAKEAYTQVLPVIQSVWNGQQISPEKIQGLEKWLETHGVKRAEPPPSDKESQQPATSNALADPPPAIGGDGP